MTAFNRLPGLLGLGLAFGVLIGPAAAVGHAQEVEEGAFVVLVDGDTVGIEHFTRTAEELEGEVVDENVGTVTYTAALESDATITEITLQASPPGAPATAPPVQEASIAFQGDSAIAQVTSGAQSQVQRVGTDAGTMPFFNPSFALLEQVLKRAREVGGDQVEIPLFLVMGAHAMPATVTWVATDSAKFEVAGTELHAALDDQGRLIRARIPAQNLEVERVAGADTAAVGSRNTDQRGG